MKVAEARFLLEHTALRPFTKEDWYGFAGCESKNPLIGEGPGETLLVVDGDTLLVITADTADWGGELFNLDEVFACTAG